MKINQQMLKYSWLCILILLPLNFVQGSVSSHTQRISKVYKLNHETTVYISNKYGKIHISNWNKDSVEFEINLTIRSSNYTRVYKLKDNINFDFVQTKYNITATTIFGNRYNSNFSDLKNLAESFVSTENQVSIDYFVKIPVWANLNIDHKYGDIYLDDAEGEMTITLSNGDIKANSLKGHCYLNFNSCDANIYFIKDGKVNINYTDFTLKSGDKVDVISKSCNVYLDDIDYLKIDSRRDKYFISSIKKTFGDTYFSDFNVYELEDEISYDMKYGTITLDKVAKTFSLINLSSEYTDITILFNKSVTYNFDMTHYNDISFYYPKELSKLQEKLVDEESNEYLVYGSIGPSSTSSSKLNIKAFKKCYIRIEHK